MAAILVVTLGGSDEPGSGATEVVSAEHPSGVRVVAPMAGGGTVEIQQIGTTSVDLADDLRPVGAWSVGFGSELRGEAEISVPGPVSDDYSVLMRVDGVWRPVPFSIEDGDLVLMVEGGAAAPSAGAAAIVLAAGEGGVAAAPDMDFWSRIELAIATIDVASWLDDLLMAADRQGARLADELAGFADPPMCSQPSSGVSIGREGNTGSLLEVCVEDRSGGQVIRVGNHTRFALELWAIGVDVERVGGGTDMSRIGSRGVVVDGGGTVEWTAAPGSTFTVTAEFTEYAFLKQVTGWVVGLIPAGSEVLERGEDVVEAIGILQDALSIGAGLAGVVDDLERGDYRGAFGGVASLLVEQRVIDELVDRGFFERLGYGLAEDTVEDLFTALDLAGYLADLGDLLYRAWATDGYVHAEVVVRLQAGGQEPPSTTAPPVPASSTSTAAATTTTTAAPAEPVVEVASLGSQTAGTRTYPFDLPDDFTQVRVAFHDHDDDATTYRYGGWAAEMSVNGTPVYGWLEFDGVDSIYHDYLRDLDEYGGEGVGEWWDVTALVSPGPNEIVYHHFNEGPGIGVKLEVTRGGPGQAATTTTAAATTTTAAATTTTGTLPPNLGTGDVQVTLLWDSAADLDLHVVDPDGDEIFFSNRRVDSGGELDVDANGNCEGEWSPVENVYWPSGEAPRGAYRVAVHYFPHCDAPSPAAYTVVVTVDGAEAHRWEGTVGSDEAVWYDFSY
ncbi:MAG: hypothetical protein KQH83_11935 [Actinobacteria bacterium]|nr:hypothetical protein [Actinomycetota bacterium]